MRTQARSNEEEPEVMAEGAVGTTRAALSRPSSWATWAEDAAFAWALLFAAAHVYWALGGTALLGENADLSAGVLFDREPWTYVFGWGILSVLFVFAGLFPLALVWTCGKRISRSVVQTGVVSLAYAGMMLLTLFALATQASGLVLLGMGICGLGVVFAIVHPRDRATARWTVLGATWGLGLAMSVYGCAHVVAAVGVAAVGEMDSELFLIHLITGGVSWLGGDRDLAEAGGEVPAGQLP